MIIARFGDTWSTAYEFAETQGDDVWSAERTAIIQQVGGAAGAYDFFGDANFPIAPLLITKKFTLSSSTYAGLETDLDTLRAATIAADKTKLWGERRGGKTSAYRRWAWAKCVKGPGTPEHYRDGNYIKAPVELQFLCPEGLWYAEGDGSANRTGTGDVTCVNNGNVNALVVATIAAGATDVQLSLYDGVDLICQVTWTGTTSGTGLVIDARAYSCTNNGADAYDTLTVGGTGPSDPAQIAWFWLPPGSNTVTVEMLSGSVLATLEWRHPYVL